MEIPGLNRKAILPTGSIEYGAAAATMCMFPEITARYFIMTAQNGINKKAVPTIYYSGYGAIVKITYTLLGLIPAVTTITC